MTLLVLVTGALCAPRPVRAREYEAEIMVSSPEELYDMLRSGELEEETVDTLVALMDRPLDLNRASRNLLYDLPAVTYELADAMIAYRRDHGGFQSVQELLQVPGFTGELLESVQPFVVVSVAAAADTQPGADVRGKAKMGSIWRNGFAKSIDPALALDPGPQTYLKADVTGYTYLGAGLMGTFRKRTSVYWDEAHNILASPGTVNQLDLDNAYLTWAYGGWSVIAGTYDVGFGERLTFDTSIHRDPEGSYVSNNASDDNEKGTMSVDQGLFGLAATYNGLDVGAAWLDATVFASSQLLDIYQSGGIIYQPDELTLAGDCEFPYDDDDPKLPKLCHTAKVWDEDLPFARDVVDSEGRSSRVLNSVPTPTIRDAFRETLVGGNLTFNPDETAHLGLTAYQGMTDIVIGREDRARFATGAGRPSNNRFSAVGADARLELGPVALSGEYAQTRARLTSGGPAGNGAYGRAIWTGPQHLEASVSVRYYDALYTNPRGRAESQADEAEGYRARNEAGAKAQLIVTPLPGLRSVTAVDGWRALKRGVYDAAGNLAWGALPTHPVNLKLSERLSYKLTRDERLSLLAEMSDKDLSHGGAQETYSASGDEFFDCVIDAVDRCDLQPAARGERYKLQLGATTTRLDGVSLNASYSVAWEGSGKSVFDTEQKVRLRSSIKAWPGGLLVLGVSYWYYARNLELVQNRDNPACDGYFDLAQRVGDRFTLRARYGIVNYRSASAASYNWYHLAKVAFEARF